MMKADEARQRTHPRNTWWDDVKEDMKCWSLRYDVDVKNKRKRKTW